MLFFPLRGKFNLFPRHFSLILLGSARLVGIKLGVNIVCTYKIAYNVILIKRLKEICGVRKPLEAAVGLTSRANKRYVSPKVTSEREVICFF